jgi:hypothetical protein
MGMPCEVNSILRLAQSQDFPNPLHLNQSYQVTKQGYRIFPLDVPIQLVDGDWLAHADVTIHQLTWHQQTTTLTFEITRIYPLPFPLK